MQIQRHIRSYGAAVVTAMLVPSNFQTWFKGARKHAVYDDKQAEEQAARDPNAFLHAVVLAGYNNEQQYWIIWSSWGNWADGAFARVGGICIGFSST
jgi:hypothetical protein